LKTNAALSVILDLAAIVATWIRKSGHPGSAAVLSIARGFLFLVRYGPPDACGA
jgi:hypothetical protein